MAVSLLWGRVFSVPILTPLTTVRLGLLTFTTMPAFPSRGKWDAGEAGEKSAASEFIPRTGTANAVV